jgi:hypothetical protein
MVDQTIQVDKEIQVPKTVMEEREIRIPQPVMETRTVKVPRQRIVMEEEEVSFPNFLVLEGKLLILNFFPAAHCRSSGDRGGRSNSAGAPNGADYPHSSGLHSNCHPVICCVRCCSYLRNFRVLEFGILSGFES